MSGCLEHKVEVLVFLDTQVYWCLIDLSTTLRGADVFSHLGWRESCRCKIYCTRKKDLLLSNRAAIKPCQNATRPYKGIIEPSFQDAIQIQLFDNISPSITLFSPKFRISFFLFWEVFPRTSHFIDILISDTFCHENIPYSLLSLCRCIAKWRPLSLSLYLSLSLSLQGNLSMCLSSVTLKGQTFRMAVTLG